MSVLDFYRRNQPHPDGKVFRREIPLTSAMSAVNIQPPSGKMILIDRVVLAVSVNFALSAALGWQIKSSTAGVTGTTGVYTEDGSTYFTVGGSTAPTPNIVGFCDEVYTAAFSSNLVVGVSHMRPPIKVTNSEYVIVDDNSTAATITGTITMYLHGWFLNDATRF